MREELMPGLGRSFARAWARAGLVVAFTLVLISSPTSTLWAKSQYKSLHRFTSEGRGGRNPDAGLVADLQGNLYGTTEAGGAHKYGTVFRLAPDDRGGWKQTVLHSFNLTDGYAPQAGLIFDATGNLYGTTGGGGSYDDGTVFELAPNGLGGWTETVVHSFNGSDGSWPVAGMIFDSAGNLYGMTHAGGANDFGTVFELAPNGLGGWTEAVLHSFNGADGVYPLGTLIFDAAGNLYGTTPFGGANDSGTVFELEPDGHGGWTETVLHSFNVSDGTNPSGTLIFDSAGNLYGTTNRGGAYGVGVVFELSPDGHGGWNETVLHSFNKTDVAFPVAGLIFDTAGNLFGTTWCSDANHYGAVFELAPHGHGGWKLTVLHSFKDRPGGCPLGSLIFGRQGHLYGVTFGDNQTTFGSVFEVAP